MSKMVARLLPFYEFDTDDFFRSDGAPPEVAEQRRDAFFRLARLYEVRYAKGRQMTAEASSRISDLQFTEAYRVPFQYSRLVREHLSTSAFVQSAAGVTVTDIDGNRLLRPDRLLRRQYLWQRFLQGVHRRGR